MFRTPLHGDSSYHRGLRESVTSGGENLAKEASIECERAEVLVSSICRRQRSLTPRGAVSEQNVCHTCDGHQKGVDGLIVWRACEGRDTQHSDLCRHSSGMCLPQCTAAASPTPHNPSGDNKDRRLSLPLPAFVLSASGCCSS